MSTLEIIESLKSNDANLKFNYPNGLEIKLSVTGIYDVSRLRIIVQNNGHEEGEVMGILTDTLTDQSVVDKIRELCLRKDENFEVTDEAIYKSLYTTPLSPNH